jgi:exosortase B
MTGAPVSQPAAAPASQALRATPAQWLWLAGGWLALYLPTYRDFLVGPWQADAQGHEPLVMAAVAWLLWQRRAALRTLPTGPAAVGAATFALGLLAYWLGRNLQWLRLELGSQTLVLAGLLMLLKGPRALQVAWFPLLFMLFAMPMPYSWVLEVTAPLKDAVSASATGLLALAGYPVGRSGVVISIGQYQLLVAEACAGLQTMFALEGLGLFYVNLRNYKTLWRSATMTVMVVPVSFAANVLRVVLLALLTYHFGDAVGQGFLHGFSGMVLFVAALCLLLLIDCGVDSIERPARAR